MIKQAASEHARLQDRWADFYVITHPIGGSMWTALPKFASLGLVEASDADDLERRMMAYLEDTIASDEASGLPPRIDQRAFKRLCERVHEGT